MKEYHFVKKRKQFLRGGYYYRGSSTPASRFRTKKSRSPSYQNLPYTMLKRRFAFLYASTSLHKKTLTVASNRNFESFLPIRCVAPQRILRFFAAGFAFAFAFGNSARYCVVLLNALLSDREKKKAVCNGFVSTGNLDPSSLTPGGPIALLFCGLRRRDNLLARRELFANLY